MLTEHLRDISTSIERMRTKLRSLQRPDGGFPGYYIHDTCSGVWSTAEIVHAIARTAREDGDEDCLKDACQYLLENQNEDGGWPFRSKGKSIVDITSWCCLALSHFGHDAAIIRGVRFLLTSRSNSGTRVEDGWGLTINEYDRVYSTWIASYCLSRLLRANSRVFDEELTQNIASALGSARNWLLSVRNADGGWGPAADQPSNFTSTATALLTLFLQGENPVQFADAYRFLARGIQEDLWPPETELLITQEGYELNQEWFSSAYCFRAMIFFSEMNVAPLATVHLSCQALLALIAADGTVSRTRNATADVVWTIPFMIEALEKYKAFADRRKSEFALYLDRIREQNIVARKQSIQQLLNSQFPFPVSQAFSSYQHELDYHRRYQLLTHLYEVAIKYAALVGLAGYLAANEDIEAVRRFLSERFARPSLGDWATLLQVLLKHSANFGKLIAPFSSGDVLRTKPNYLDAGYCKENLSEMLSHIVSERNSNIGHGALRSLYEYKVMVDDEEARLYSLVDRLRFLSGGNSFLVLESRYDEFGEGDKYRIRIFKGLGIQDHHLETASRLSEGQKDVMIRYIYFQNSISNVIVNLYPFLSYMFCVDCKKEHFFFYNGTRERERVGYISYECGHAIEQENRLHFQKRFSHVGITW